MELKAGPDEAGERLDAFLAGPLGSRARAQRLIEGGNVLVDGRRVAKSHLISEGEVVAVTEPDEPEAPASTAAAQFAIAYEDEHLVVVDKPAGVVVHPARGHRTGTLAQALAGTAAGGDEGWRAGIVHRLDRDTSGLLVVAKSEAVHRALKSALGGAADRAGVPGAGRGAPTGARRARSTPPSDETGACGHGCRPTPTTRARRARTSRSNGPCRRPRCFASAWRPVAHIRSAPTSRPSATPCAAIPSTAARGCSASTASSCTRPGSRSTHPVTGAPVDVSSRLPADLEAALQRAAHAHQPLI